MEIKIKLSAQNVIGRITHGLIGLDIFLNERKTNEYLSDFLTLKEDEIKEAFLSTSIQKKLVPSCAAVLSTDEIAFIQSVKKVQTLVSNIDSVKSDKTIEDSINELGGKMDIIYATVAQE